MKRRKKEKKRETEVSAPSKPTLRPEEIIAQTRQKDLLGERFEVLELARKIGKKFGYIPLLLGSSLLILLVYLFAIDIVLANLVISSPETEVFFVILSLFLGVVNVLTGLLLMSD